MKKIFFLAYLSIFSIVISQTYSYDKLQFDLIPDMNEYEVSALNEEIEGDIFIPPYYKEFPVTAVKMRGFAFCEGINVFLPETIKSIKRAGFVATNLNFISLNEGLKRIEENAFMASNLKYVKIPKTVEYIGSFAFGSNNETLIVEVMNNKSVSANWHECWDWVNEIDEGLTVTVIWNNTVSDSDNKTTYTHSVGATCIVAETLRLRKEENTSSATIQTMQPGMQVQILQLGKKETIDGITANWVQVQLADETTGWCFGGYLVEK